LKVLLIWLLFAGGTFWRPVLRLVLRFVLFPALEFGCGLVILLMSLWHDVIPPFKVFGGLNDRLHTHLCKAVEKSIIGIGKN